MQQPRQQQHLKSLSQLFLIVSVGYAIATNKTKSKTEWKIIT